MEEEGREQEQQINQLMSTGQFVVFLSIAGAVIAYVARKLPDDMMPDDMIGPGLRKLGRWFTSYDLKKLL